MVTNKSLDFYVEVIASLLCDISQSHSGVLTARALRLTLRKFRNRTAQEGIGFLTKTLPRLGKAFDLALTGVHALDAAALRFDSLPNSKLPRFLGELFVRIFSHDGRVLPEPCVISIKHVRQVCYTMYKLELPYTKDCEQSVVDKFIRTDNELSDVNKTLLSLGELFDNGAILPSSTETEIVRVARKARDLLSEVFLHFDILDIHPKHGPGAVSTKEKLEEKYVFRTVSPRTLQTYPLDAYYFASNGHVCDELVRNDDHYWHSWKRIELGENPARVCLVPKDSRGPRLISCEPLEFQWIQQGLGGALVNHIEGHPLTRYALHFTDQTPNRCGAFLGSRHGRYSTLDLNEASDRVSIGLVALLFQEPLRSALMNCRSLSTVLPDGSNIVLNKFAPMGSSLCFPVLATCIWALLTAGLPDAEDSGACFGCTKCTSRTCERILVYGDDVIVPTAKAEKAMRILESFGLKINRDKSCTSGFFRESCGADAYKGVDVTPVRLRTVWRNHIDPESYTSYIAYANAFYKKGYYQTYEKIVRDLLSIYEEIPDAAMNLSCPSLVVTPEGHLPRRSRVNSDLQKVEWRVRDVAAPKYVKRIGGWKMLLRFFAEATTDTPLKLSTDKDVETSCGLPIDKEAFSVSVYTERKTSKIVWRWR